MLRRINPANGSRAVSSARKSVLHTHYGAVLGANETGHTHIRYSFDDCWHDDEPYGQSGQSLFTLPGASHNLEPGMPMLIQEGIFVALPPNAEYSDVEVRRVKEKLLDGTYDILPAPKPSFESEPLVFSPNRQIYSADSAYPSGPVRSVKVMDVLGVKCALVTICPMRYAPLSGKITLLSEIDLHVKYTFTGVSAEAHRLTRPDFANLLLGYRGAAAEDPPAKQRLLIIMPKIFDNAMDAYIADKGQTYAVEKVFYEDILAQHPQPDTAPPQSGVEAIFEFLQKEHKTNSIRHCVLAGDVCQIPTMRENVTFEDETFELVSDSYYCMDTKNDDYMPKFSLSRFPASTVAEITEQSAVAANYPSKYSGKRKHAVFTTYCVDDDGDDDDDFDYNQCKDAIYANIQPADGAEAKMTVKKIYSGSSWTKDDLIDAIEAGNGFVNYRGHGDYRRWQSDIGLAVEDVTSQNVDPDNENVDPGNDIPHIFSIACETAAIQTYPDLCFGAAWIRKLKAISFLGATISSYTMVNDCFDKYLWESIVPSQPGGMAFSVVADIYLNASICLMKNSIVDGKVPEHVKLSLKIYLLLGDGTADYLKQLPASQEA
ncbi:MAG: C25 family cysteine peptidase [Synergistaceae bacterium]|jgi:hypothetical protein|nr:C25 family cysteine peptidase [Synergistaceae bacterium]